MTAPATVWLVWTRGEEVSLFDEAGGPNANLSHAQVSVSIHAWDLHSVHAREESARCVAAGNVGKSSRRCRVESREVAS